MASNTINQNLPITSCTLPVVHYQWYLVFMGGDCCTVECVVLGIRNMSENNNRLLLAATPLSSSSSYNGGRGFKKKIFKWAWLRLTDCNEEYLIVLLLNDTEGFKL